MVERIRHARAIHLRWWWNLGPPWLVVYSAQRPVNKSYLAWNPVPEHMCRVAECQVGQLVLGSSWRRHHSTLPISRRSWSSLPEVAAIGWEEWRKEPWGGFAMHAPKPCLGRRLGGGATGTRSEVKMNSNRSAVGNNEKRGETKGGREKRSRTHQSA